MSTCIRNGVTYGRHWYDDDNVCQQCGHLSPWAKEQLLKREAALKPTTSDTNNGSTITELINIVETVDVGSKKYDDGTMDDWK